MDIVISKQVLVPAAELEFTTSRSGGPGGQHVNKVNSRVTLRFNIRNSSSLTNQHKQRIISSLGTRVNKEGVLRLHSQKYRSQSANRDDLIERFIALLGKALISKRPRIPTKITKSAKERRILEKKIRGQIKKKRSRPIAGD